MWSYLEGGGENGTKIPVGTEETCCSHPAGDGLRNGVGREMGGLWVLEKGSFRDSRLELEYGDVGDWSCRRPRQGCIVDDDDDDNGQGFPGGRADEVSGCWRTWKLP